MNWLDTTFSPAEISLEITPSLTKETYLQTLSYLHQYTNEIYYEYLCREYYKFEYIWLKIHSICMQKARYYGTLLNYRARQVFATNKPLRYLHHAVDWCSSYVCHEFISSWRSQDCQQLYLCGALLPSPSP